MTAPDRAPVLAGKDWPAHYTYVPALRVGDMVFLSGTTGPDDHGRITAPGDIVEQTRQIFRKFEQLLNAAGAPEAAIQYLERPGTISHLSIDDLILMGDAYLQSGDSIMAEAIWKHVSELEASNSADKRLVNLYIQRKEYSSAVLVLEVLLRNTPSDIDLYYQVGSLYAITDPIKALPFLAQSEEIDSVDSDHANTLHDKIRTASLFDTPSYTLLIIGRQFANWGEWDLATEGFHNATVLQPDYADAWAASSHTSKKPVLRR